MLKHTLLISICLGSAFVMDSIYANNSTQIYDHPNVVIKISTYAVLPPAGYKYCDATVPVGLICNGQQKCSVYVNDAICGDPSPGVIKHLTTTYSCGTHSYLNDTTEYNVALFDCINPVAHGAKQLN